MRRASGANAAATAAAAAAATSPTPAHGHEHFSLSVELSNPNAVYVSGRPLQGKVVLRVKRHALAFRGAELQFVGEGFVQYLTMHFSAKARHEKYCHLTARLSADLLASGGGAPTAVAGTATSDGPVAAAAAAAEPATVVELSEGSCHEFAFEMLLPGGLPSSFADDGRIGHNRYYLLCYLSGHDSHDGHHGHVCRKEITVLSLAKLSDELACPLARFSVDDDDSLLSLELTVDRHGYMPGDRLRFSARATNIADRKKKKKKKKTSTSGSGSSGGECNGGSVVVAAGAGGVAGSPAGGGTAGSSGGGGGAVLRKAVLFVLQHVSFHASGKHSDGRVKTRLLAVAERQCDVRRGESLVWDGEVQLPDPLPPSTTPLQEHRIGFRYEVVLVGAMKGAITDTMELYDEARYHFEGERFKDSAIRDFLPHACAEVSIGSMDARGGFPPSVRGLDMVASLSDDCFRKRKTSCIG